jgi:hypothetical protein
VVDGSFDIASLCFATATQSRPQQQSTGKQIEIARVCFALVFQPFFDWKKRLTHT